MGGQDARGGGTRKPRNITSPSTPCSPWPQLALSTTGLAAIRGNKSRIEAEIAATLDKKSRLEAEIAATLDKVARDKQALAALEAEESELVGAIASYETMALEAQSAMDGLAAEESN